MRIILQHPPNRASATEHRKIYKKKTNVEEWILKNFRFLQPEGFHHLSAPLGEHRLCSLATRGGAGCPGSFFFLNFPFFLNVVSPRWSWCCPTWTTRTTRPSGLRRPPRRSCGTRATASTPSPSPPRMSSCQGEKQKITDILNNDACAKNEDKVDKVDNAVLQPFPQDNQTTAGIWDNVKGGIFNKVFMTLKLDFGNWTE